MGKAVHVPLDINHGCSRGRFLQTCTIAAGFHRKPDGRVAGQPRLCRTGTTSKEGRMMKRLPCLLTAAWTGIFPAPAS